MTPLKYRTCAIPALLGSVLISAAAAQSAPTATPWTMLRLPDTGQTTRHTATPGEDSYFTLNPPSFRVNGDGTVADLVTGLQWQQADAGEMEWAAGVAYCKTLDLGGKKDWRLPYVHELFSILNHESNRPPLDTKAFIKSDAEYWWAIEQRVDNPSYAWAVNAGGGAGAHPKNETVSAGGKKVYDVRCVRGAELGKPGDRAYKPGGDGTVTDSHTGLVWQQQEGLEAATWEEALHYVATLNLGGHKDWRLPNLKELQSISTAYAARPSIDTAAFPDAASALYWSSTTLAQRATRAWTIDFRYGVISYNDKSDKLRVRAVRGGTAPPAPIQARDGGATDPMRWGTPTNDGLPNPYRTVSNWAELPEGRPWGSTAGVTIDPMGHIWVAERCGKAYPDGCGDSHLAPILEFDPSGKLIRAIGADMFVFPHGITADRDGNIWVTDERGMEGKGYVAIKFSPTGEVLMVLGTRGVAGTGPGQFDGPKAVAIADNGDIFVSDGGRNSARIVKFDKTGKYLMEWGKFGSGPGEMDTPHCLAFDSRGRLFVGDRGNNRIQIFDTQGSFIAQWTQFSRPSGIAIDQRDDTIYVADSESGGVSPDHAAWRRGIRIGSARDGSLRAFIPDPNTTPGYRGSSAAEGVAVDSQGIVYGAEVGQKDLKKYLPN